MKGKRLEIIVLIVAFVILAGALFLMFYGRGGGDEIKTIVLVNRLFSLGFLVYIAYSYLLSTNLNNEITSLNNHIDNLKKEVVRQNKKIDDQQNQIKTRDQQISGLEQERDEINSKNESLSKELTKIKKELNDLRQKTEEPAEE